jgi:hypothetical protein
MNKSKGKLNQPPTGEGKKQSPYSGEFNKSSKRSEVLQANRNRKEDNITDQPEDPSMMSNWQEKDRPGRPKAGR